MEIGIGVKVDPGDSVTKAKAVEDGLHRTEDAGKAAAQSMLALAGAFRTLAQAMQQQMAALERSGQAHRFLTSSMAGASAGFGKMAEAMQREQAMLERIHGPARRYAEDLQVLDSLLSRNVINTSQYAEQVRKLNSAIDGTPRVANGNVPTPSGSSALSAVRGGAAALGIGVSVSQIGGMANEFQNLENRLRYLAGGDMAKVNSMFGELQGVASRTRGDLSATTESFVRMSLATKQMGLSTSDAMLLTERLNKAIALSGATGAEAAAGMIQLSQGLASGALRGDELRSVMEQLPAVADVIAQGLGVTRGELRNLGAQGKITADVIVESFKKAGTTLDKDFGNTVPTLSQSWTVFKNEMMVTIGELNKSLGITDALGSAMGALGTAVNLVTAPLKMLSLGFDAIGVSGGSVTKALGAMAIGALALGGPGGALVGLGLVVADAAGAFDSIVDSYLAAAKAQEALNAAQTKAFYSMFQGAEATRQAYKEMTELTIATMAGADAAHAFAFAWKIAGDAQKGFIGSYKASRLDTADSVAKKIIGERIDDVNNARTQLEGLEKAYAKGGTTVALYRQEKQKLLDIINGTTAAMRKQSDELSASDQILLVRQRERWDRAIAEQREKERQLAGGGSVVSSTGFQIGQPDSRFSDTDHAMRAQRERSDEINREMQTDFARARQKRDEETAEANRKLVEDAQKSAQEVKEAWASGLGSIAGSFLDAAMAGKQSFGEMTMSMLRDIAMLTLKMAAMKAIAGGGSGAVGGQFLMGLMGGANGFSYVANDNARQLPGFATGGSFTVAGAGGTDSKVAAFRVTPGESVHVRTPQQTMAEAAYVRELRMMAAQGGAQGPAQITILPSPTDPNEVSMGLATNEGQKAQLRNDRRNGMKRRRLG